MTAVQRFTATLELGGKTATGVEVPAEVVEQLAAGRKPAVRVTINQHTYPSTVASMNGRFMLPVSAENRTAAGIAAGDVVDVAVELDTAPREIAVPADFAAALDGEPEAKRFFAGLSYSNQRWHVEPITGAKSAETRQRRIEKSLGLLRDRRAR